MTDSSAQPEGLPATPPISPDPNRRLDSSGKTPLIEAVKTGDPARLRALLAEPGFVVMPAVWDGISAKLGAAYGSILPKDAFILGGRDLLHRAPAQQQLQDLAQRPVLAHHRELEPGRGGGEEAGEGRGPV